MSVTEKCCSAALAAMALAAEASWNPGEPVVTYWYGPGCCRNGRDYIPLDDFWAKQLKEGIDAPSSTPLMGTSLRPFGNGMGES